MTEPRADSDDFLYRPASYRGEFTPEGLVFNANLQEFARRIGFICDLETNGKISSTDAFVKIRALWEQLDLSGKSLGISD